MRPARWLGLFLLLAGCYATPIGQLPPSALLWEERTIPVPYQEAHRRIIQWFRTCPHWVQTGFLWPDLRMAQLDVFMGGVSGPGWGADTLATIAIQAQPDNRTLVKIGVRDRFFMRPKPKLWLRAAEENAITCK